MIIQRLRDVAGTQDLQNELIRTSVKDVSAIVEVIEQLGAVGAEDKEGAATATRTLARIHQQAGRLMEGLGRNDEAIRYYRQMDELAESLAAGNPGQIDAKKPLASSKITIGEFEMNRLGDSKAALGHLEQNLALRREFLADKPSDEESTRGVANALGKLARVWLKLGDPLKASDYYKEEALLRGQIGGNLAGEVEFRREGAGLEEKLGDMYVGLDNISAAGEHFDRSLEIREEIVEENPGNNQAERDLVLSSNKLGTFHLLQRKDPAAARKFYEKALAEFEAPAPGRARERRGQGRPCRDPLLRRDRRPPRGRPQGRRPSLQGLLDDPRGHARRRQGQAPQHRPDARPRAAASTRKRRGPRRS